MLNGEKEKGEELFKKYMFYLYAYETRHYENAGSAFEYTKQSFEKDYGYKLDLSLPW